MDKIYDIRQKLKELYLKYDAYVTPVAKALTMLVILLVINSVIGYSQSFTGWNIVASAVLIAALLPWPAITPIAAVFALVNLYSLSWEVALVTAAFMFMAAVAQYVFLPGYGIAIALIPALYYLHIPYAVPLVLGVAGGMTSFIPAGVGIFFCYFLDGVSKNADYFMRTSGSGASVLERFPQIFAIIKDNKLMLISIIAFSVTTLLVHIIKKLSSDYSSYIALAVGTIANIVIFLIGGFTADASLPYIEIFVGSVVGFIVASIVILWVSAADYNHAEHLTYEDDDYIYYVKAVPKIKVTAKKVKIRDLTSDESEADSEDIRIALEALSEIEEKERR